MEKDKVEVHLQKLLNYELSLSSSDDKKHVIYAYDTLINILQTPEIRKQLSGQHELLFECISQIILTSFNQYFHDDQLHFLLKLALNTCVLSMSQNQIINNWLQNIEERTFEKQDSYDDNDLYKDATESEEYENIKSASNQLQRKYTYNDDSSHHDLSSVSPRDKSRPLAKPISTQHYISTVNLDNKRNGTFSDVSSFYLFEIPNK